MDQAILRNLASEFLVPFFSGARLDDETRTSSSDDDPVALLDPVSIAFKLKTGDPYRLVMHRSQPFAIKGEVVVREIDVVRAFVAVLGPMEAMLGFAYEKDILSTFHRRVVARSIAPNRRWDTTLLGGIDQLMEWASRLYEGRAISASIGFRQLAQPEGTPTLAEIANQDFCALLSNGHDTLLEFDAEGRFVDHVSLPALKTVKAYCPYRQIPIAEWTRGDEHLRRVALVLNRLGELLVIRDGQLLFARRSGRWSFLTHEPVITQMATPHNKTPRRAVYQTCLDASFGRTGACIGIVSSSLGAKWRNVVDKNDRISGGKLIKAKTVAKLLHGVKFHSLDRRLRQELVAVDGATIISHTGEILAVGAILKIPGGSTGGGRLAAAKTLSEFGVGIKVSQDGGVIGFRFKDEAFWVM